MALTLERFEVVRRIGDGSYGYCQFARRRRSKNIGTENVVLKQLSRGRDGNREVFINECRILATLKFPFIITFREQFETEEHFVIVTDYADGGSLSQLIKQQKVRSELVMNYFIQLTEALYYLHRKEILHRDVKPDNVFLNWSHTFVRLGDFGSAIDKRNATEHQLIKNCGTREYSAPEMLTERMPVTEKCDMWSLGCVLYELLEQKPAFPYGCHFSKIENWEYDSLSPKTDPLGIFFIENLLIDHHFRWSAQKILAHGDLAKLRINLLTRHWKIYQFDENVDHSLTSLHFAAINGQLDKIQRLHDVGTKLETTDCFGFTPLLCASAEGKQEAIELLIKLGADPQVKNYFGLNASIIALLNDQIHLMRIFIDHGQSLQDAQLKREKLLLDGPKELKLTPTVLKKRFKFV